MPYRFFDYEKDLVRSTQAHIKSPAINHTSNRRSSSDTTSSPTSASTTRSSVSESSQTSPPPTYRHHHQTSQRPPNVQSFNPPTLPVSRHQQQATHTALTNPFKHTSYSHAASVDNYRSASHGDPMIPTDEIQEWSHQVHVAQDRKHNWCVHCTPRKVSDSNSSSTTGLEIPSDKAMKKVRIMEPSHAYQ